MLLKDRRILIMGLLDTRSVAWAIGTRAAAEGAEVTYVVQSERFRDTLLRRAFRNEGLNVDDYRIPDNSGNSPVDEPVVEGGPAGYFSTLPVRAIVDALEAASIPAKISNTAGTYICNHVAYALAHHLASADDPPIAGFVHIPQMAEADGWEPSLPLETLVDAVAIVVEVVARAAARV